MTRIEIIPACMAADGPPAVDCSPLSRWRPVIRRHAYIVPIFAVVLLICAWFVTWGDWRPADPEYFCWYFDAQAHSILHGRLDVPDEAITFEAFVRDGKTYGYFGIGPSLLRIPLITLFPNRDGKWSRYFSLIGCAVSLVSAYRLLVLLRGGQGIETRSQRVVNSLFILCAGIGSTMVFILARSWLYHEAIMLGTTFALLFANALVGYFNRPRVRTLVFAGIFAFFSLHCRATVGAGALLAMAVLAALLWLRCLTGPSAGHSFWGLPTIGRPLRHALAASIAATVILSTYLGVNYVKFRTFNGVPVQYYKQYQESPSRMAHLRGRQLHLTNVPTIAACYFVAPLKVSSEFPWVYGREATLTIGSPAIDIVEPFASIPFTTPALVLLSLLGVVLIARGSEQRFRRLRLPLIALLLGGGIVLMSVGVTERYVHDFFPFLIIAAAAGAARFGGGSQVRLKVAALGALAIISIWVSVSLAVEYQRDGAFGVTLKKRREFADGRAFVDRLLHRQPANPAEN